MVRSDVSDFSIIRYTDPADTPIFLLLY